MGPHNKERGIVGSLLGSPYFSKLSCREVVVLATAVSLAVLCCYSVSTYLRV